MEDSPISNIFSKPKFPEPKPATPLPQEDSEAMRRANLQERSRLSKSTGRGSVTLTEKDLGSYGQNELRGGSSSVLTG